MITREELKKVLSDFGMYLSSVKPGVMDKKQGVMLHAYISGRMIFVEGEPNQLLQWIDEIESEKRNRMLSDLCNEMI